MLIEGNSLILTLVKNISNDENRFKRINVQKIASLKNLFNSPLSEVTFEIKLLDEIEKISKLIEDVGETNVNFKIKENNKNLLFRLKEKRNIDRKSINIIRNSNISAIIN
jgi:DNA polymerase-3 subunit alpha